MRKAIFRAAFGVGPCLLLALALAACGQPGSPTASSAANAGPANDNSIDLSYHGHDHYHDVDDDHHHAINHDDDRRFSSGRAA